jgi:uncharacterized protein (TIGR03435 family)
LGIFKQFGTSAVKERKEDIVTRLIGLFCLSALLAHAQTFDVASVKAADPQPNGMIRVMMGGGPGTPDPGRINYENVSLKQVLSTAFDVKSYQINGPGWLDTDRFDITAKVPQDATKEQMHVMLQNLLADRFKMTIHRETKEMASYVLTVAKNGPKMKVVEAAPPFDPTNAPPGGRGPMAMGQMPMGKDGFPEMPKAGGRGGGPMMMMMPGKAKMVCASCPMSRLVDTLGSQLGKPVVDETGLKDNYEFTMIFEPNMDGMRGMMMAGPGRGPGGPEGGGRGGDGPGREANDEPAPPLLSAVQDQLGLKLDAKKAPVELIVVDKMEKVPTEN